MPRLRLAAVAIVAAAALLGCAPTVSATPAADADDPACARVVVSLPDEVAGLARRWTDAQATGAWGDPAAVLLACGVAVPPPTSQTCVSVSGVDWVIDDRAAPRYRLTTYGRTPAVEVLADGRVVSVRDALDALAPAVAAVPPERACTSREPDGT